MSSRLPLVVERYLTPQKLARTIAHVLVDRNGEIAASGGRLSHFGLDRSGVASIVEMFAPWFEPVDAPGDRVRVPFVQMEEDVYADVHFVADGELTWVVLVDRTSEAVIAQREQQRRLLPFYLDLRSGDRPTNPPSSESTARPSSVGISDLAPVLCQLDMGSFERHGQGMFVSSGQLPAWLEWASPELIRGDVCEPDRHPFLQCFMPDAERAWADHSAPPLQSLVWSEELTTGENVHLQAVAVSVPGRDILVLRRLFDREIRNSADVQRANNQALEAADAERRLYNESERLRVTLASIAEAVLATDHHGVIEFMNPMAEQLTGWSSAAARGRPSDEVVHLVQESTDHPIESPVAQTLRTCALTRSEGDALLVSRDGHRYGVRDSAAPIFDADGDLLGVVLVLQNVTETRAMVREVRHQAEHDQLTGLANRREFERRLDHLIADAQNSGESHVLCYLDLNNFKIVNDTDGHIAGDAVLQQVAQRLKGVVRSDDTIARVGGDEFCVLLKGCEIGAAERVAMDLMQAIDEAPFTWESHAYSVGVSIGIAPVTSDTRSRIDVMTYADEASYIAKREGVSALCSSDVSTGAIRVRRIHAESSGTGAA